MSSTILRDLKFLVPTCFLLGGAMEVSAYWSAAVRSLVMCPQLFMIKTGFYDIALRKATERAQDGLSHQVRRQNRMKELNITFDEQARS